MKENIEKAKKEFEKLTITSLEELENTRINYLGKKGIITNFLSSLKNVEKSEVKELGRLINEFKSEV